jgi:hypothetical protein
MNEVIKKIKILALIPTLLIGTRVFAQASTLRFSGDCQVKKFGVPPETQSFSLEDNENVRMRFQVGVGTTVYAQLSDGTASLEWKYLIPQAANETKGVTSLEQVNPGNKRLTYEFS